MVTDAILQFFYAVISWAFGLLPAWTVTPDNAALTGLRNFLFPLNGFLPISEMWVISDIFIKAWLALIALKWVLKMIGTLRGGG